MAGIENSEMVLNAQALMYHYGHVIEELAEDEERDMIAGIKKHAYTNNINLTSLEQNVPRFPGVTVDSIPYVPKDKPKKPNELLLTNTVLICIKCLRNVVLRGQGSWRDTGRIVDDKSHLNFVTLVVCYECGDTEALGHVYSRVTPNEIQDTIEHVLTNIRKALKGAILLHSIITEKPDGELAEKLKAGPVDMPHDEGFACECACPAYGVKTIMNGMTRQYRTMSVSGSKIVVAVPNFTSEGDTIGQMGDILLAPFNVNTALVCSVCWRNTIFSGPVSIVPLSPYVFTESEMTIIMYIVCRKCYSRNPMSDDEASELIDESERVNDIAMMRKYFNGFVDSYGVEEMGVITYIHREPAVNRLKFHTECWSLVDDQRIAVHQELL
jgi:hypothetical protein